MPATIHEVKANPALEQSWNGFLGSLAPWEWQYLQKTDMELFFHDEYIDGNLSLNDVRATIAVGLGIDR